MFRQSWLERLLVRREQKSAATDPVAHGAKSAGNLGNPCKHTGVGEKKPTGDPVGFSIWWSWGEPISYTSRCLRCQKLMCFQRLRSLRQSSTTFGSSKGGWQCAPKVYPVVFPQIDPEVPDFCGRGFKNGQRSQATQSSYHIRS